MIEKAGARTINKEACKLVGFAVKGQMCEMWLKGVAVREEKLYISFENMMAKDDFEKNRERILARARMYYSDNIERMRSVGLIFREIISKCEWKLPRDAQVWQKPIEEKAAGEFINNMKGKNAKLFEEIRELIKKRKEL